MSFALPDTYSFTQYLRAKESVDDAALHRPTMDRFETELDRLAERSADPLRIVDVGAGVGSMFRRLLSWDVLPDDATYVVLDANSETVRAARETTYEWAASSDREAAWEADDRLHLPESGTTVQFVTEDAFDHLDARTYDALVGHAFADLIDLPDALPRLFDGVESDGVCYFPVTFDGQTSFQPTDDDATTRAIVEAYHATMNLDDGSAQFGRALLDALVAADAELLSAGGSDWVVFPPYDGDQAYFLHHLLHFVEESVGETDAVESETLRAWLDARHKAVEEGELTFLAQNVDVLCRVS